MTRRVSVSGTEYSLPSTLTIPSRDRRRCMRNTVVYGCAGSGCSYPRSSVKASSTTRRVVPC